MIHNLHNFFATPRQTVGIQAAQAPLGFLSVHSDPRQAGSVAQEEPPVPTAEISSKQIWHPVWAIYNQQQQELALPGV